MNTDARPPSDETPATGWHAHKNGPGWPWVHRDVEPCYLTDTPIPVLVVDPAEAREKIARAIYHTYGQDDGLRSAAIADAVLAALTIQEPKEGAR